MASARTTYDTIILGAGGAGLMCAGVAGQRGRRILLVDHNGDPGRKILISGGGRCNFTNLHVAPDRYLSANEHFAKSALGRYSAQDFIDLVDRYKIAWHEKTLGQLFCDGPARQIVDMLISECPRDYVDFAFGVGVQSVQKTGTLFCLSLSDGRTVQAPSLVVATGGPSIPKLGASDFAYELAGQFDIPLQPPRPALVPLTLNRSDSLFQRLSGVATPVRASCGSASFDEAALFTHKGLSGPAILQISSYWEPGTDVQINFLPGALPDWLLNTKQSSPRLSLTRALAERLPARLADALATRLRVDLATDVSLSNTSDSTLRRAQKQLSAWAFTPNGTEGYAKAEVTAGGVCTGALSSKTMGVKSVPGLYFIGEAVDVTGWLGGYNFQWAWASGQVAAQDLQTPP